MKTEFIPALAILLLASGGAWARDDWSHHDNDWNNGWNNQSNSHHNRGWNSGHDRHQRHGDDYRYSGGNTTYIYQSARPPVVIYEAPRVVYRDRVIYRDVPVYQEQAYGYPQSLPQRQYSNGSPLVGTAIGAIAGGALGNQFGKVNGRTASTAIGAVIGGALGGEYLGR